MQTSLPAFLQSAAPPTRARVAAVDGPPNPIEAASGFARVLQQTQAKPVAAPVRRPEQVRAPAPFQASPGAAAGATTSAPASAPATAPTTSPASAPVQTTASPSADADSGAATASAADASVDRAAAAHAAAAPDPSAPPRAKSGLDGAGRRPAPNLKSDHATPELGCGRIEDLSAADEALQIVARARDGATIDVALPQAAAGLPALPAALPTDWLAALPANVVATTAAAWLAVAADHQDEGSGPLPTRRLADAGLAAGASATAAADWIAMAPGTAADAAGLAQRSSEPTPDRAPNRAPDHATDRASERDSRRLAQLAPAGIDHIQATQTSDRPATGPAARAWVPGAGVPLASTDLAALAAPDDTQSPRLAAQDGVFPASGALPRAADARRGAIEIQGFDPALAPAHDPVHEPVHKPAPKAGSTDSPGAATAVIGNGAMPDAPRGDPPALTGPTLMALADAAATPVPQLTSGPHATTTPLDRGVSAGSSDAAGRSSAPAEAQINAPLHSAAFGPALGLQISALARDGTQEARLHLNPAELGPITVRIALDGAGARVDFQADLAATRQAIEASLPALAGALRESGLTLTGGGVSQQPSGHHGAAHSDGSGRSDHRGDQPGDARAGTGQSAGDELLRPLRGASLRRGLVDLVA